MIYAPSNDIMIMIESTSEERATVFTIALLLLVYKKQILSKHSGPDEDGGARSEATGSCHSVEGSDTHTARLPPVSQR